MGSITGLKKGAFTSIDNSGEFRLDTNLDPGTVGEVIVSGGPNQPATWGPNGVAVPNALTAGTNITYTSGAASWDGAIADTINATDTDTTYTASSGMKLIGTAFLTDNDGITINNSGGTGAQNQVLKVPNSLTAGTDISFSSGTTYDGSAAITINSTATDTTYQGGDNITIDVFTNPDTIDLDKTITDMTSIQFNSSGTSTSIVGSSYHPQI